MQQPPQPQPRPDDQASTPDSQREQFVERMTRHQRELYGFILSLTGRPADAEDVLQETNIVLWRKVDEYDPARPFMTWACRIAHFQVLAYLKRVQRDRLAFLDERLLSSIAEIAARYAEQPDRRLQALRECLEQLPEHSRALIRQRYFSGQGVQNIAEALGRSAGAVSVALHRARSALLACIEKKLHPSSQP